MKLLSFVMIMYSDFYVCFRYGIKVRFPHALVMSLLFKDST